MLEGLSNGGLDLRRAHLPVAACGAFAEAAEFLAVGNPVGLDLQPMMPEDPISDLLVGGGLR